MGTAAGPASISAFGNRGSCNLKRLLVKLARLLEIWRIEVGDDTIWNQLWIPLWDITQSLFPILAPHVYEAMRLIQVTDVSEPLRQPANVKSASDPVRRFLTASANRTGLAVQNSGKSRIS